jgi:DNA-binding MarR family transcriptional regulator
MSEDKPEAPPGTPPASYEALEAYVPYLVNRLASLGQMAQNRKLSAANVSNVVLRTLSILHIENGLTINEITARAFADQSTASRAVDSMGEAGLIERRTPSTDMRRREIVLTEAGRTLLFQCWPLMEDYYATLSRGIDSEDVAVCQRVLSRMIDNLRREIM